MNGFDLARGKCYWVAIEAIVQSCTLITKLVTEVFNSLGKEKRNSILITWIWSSGINYPRPPV